MGEGRYRYLYGRRDNDVLILVVTEPQLRSIQFDISDVLREEIIRAVEEAKATKVVMDLSAVEQFGSASFRPLLSLRRYLNERRGQLVLCGLRPLIRDVFLVTRLIDAEGSSAATFAVSADVAEAVQRMK
jgi:anti-anti-sigma factor